jgi:hypothetical protein
MSSHIDATLPAEGLAYTADVRTNFAVAAHEISDLQSRRFGVTDGSDAEPGEIGEYIVSANPTGANATSDVPTAVAQLDLTPGCWEIWGLIDFLPPPNKSPNMICAAVSTHPDALPSDDDLFSGVGNMTMFYTTALTSGARQVLMTGQCRSNSASPLTVFLVGQSAFGGGGTIALEGYICARRVR